MELRINHLQLIFKAKLLKILKSVVILKIQAEDQKKVTHQKNVKRKNLRDCRWVYKAHKIKARKKIKLKGRKSETVTLNLK